MTGSNTFTKGLRVSAWIAYAVIVLEILYMISPFALYFYSFYAPPLRFLQGHENTAFLTQSILPHFSYQDSLVVSALQAASWPLIILGGLLFLAAFVQIYTAKLRASGAVSGGMYRFIRHPQYAALAVVGLGCTIFWPRVVACLMYATMLFLYYFLAKAEEGFCLSRYGAAYNEYLRRTGRFLPRCLEDRLPKVPALFPAHPRARFLSLIVLFVLYLGGALAVAFAVRDYAFSHLLTQYTDDEVIVSVAPLDKELAAGAIRIARADPAVCRMLKLRQADRLLAYVIPREWTIPELGVKGVRIGGDMLVHPGVHGNPPGFNRDSLTVFFAAPVLSHPGTRGAEILKNCLSWDPILEAHVEMQQEKVIAIIPRKERGEWDGIPVPIVTLPHTFHGAARGENDAVPAHPAHVAFEGDNNGGEEESRVFAGEHTTLLDGLIGNTGDSVLAQAPETGLPIDAKVLLSVVNHQAHSDLLPQS